MSDIQPVTPTISDNGRDGAHLPDPEVVVKAKRRWFGDGYKLRILEEVEQCAEGEVGAVLRREGLYSSHLTTWRQQREQGELQRPATKKRGPQPDAQAAEIARLRQENERLQRRLQQAEMILQVQKKLSQLLGPTPAPSSEAK